ncbi:nucleotide exchange factor GrpE [Ferrovibrio sp.]|uniref:nucleotide exchange factor GrpE n=1 Tax=Ferrovibrio sp. TaxID=1917215 RepID=UPI003511C19F
MTQNETQNTATETEAAPPAQTDAAEPAALLAAAQEEVTALKDRLLREAADKENLRKRLEREKEDAAKFAAGRFARDILTVADNLRRAVESAPKPAEGAAESDPVHGLIAGVEATERELLGVFERHGIARIEPKNEKFDPNLHQAMFEVEDATVPAGTVVQVIAAGYVQHGRLLRAAMVGVSKGGPQDELQPGAAVNTQA